MRNPATSVSARRPESPALVVVALGSNLGDSARLIGAAFVRLAQLSARPLRGSSLYVSTPVDCPPGSPPFLNAVALLNAPAGQSPESLLECLQDVEREFGRVPKAVHNEPRPLDLDLILFGDERRATARLTLPHPRARSRRFVLAPLAEIAPGLVWPGGSQTVAELLHALPPGEQVARLDA